MAQYQPLIETPTCRQQATQRFHASAADDLLVAGARLTLPIRAAARYVTHRPAIGPCADYVAVVELAAVEPTDVASRSGRLLPRQGVTSIAGIRVGVAKVAKIDRRHSWRSSRSVG